MGHYDKFLIHEDKRDKGMNSTTNDKGTDGKKNNSSEYNHAYYMKNKEKWGVRTEWSKDDHDFDDSNYDEKNRLGDSDFYGVQNKDGTWTVLLEDNKFKLPKGISKEELSKYMEKIDRDAEALHRDKNPTAKDIQDLVQKGIDDIVKKHGGSGEEEFDVDAAARDVIRGKYKNGAERKAALGDDYELVQKRVNEMMKKNVKHSDDDYLEHHGIKGMHWGVRRFEKAGGGLTPAGKARYADGKVSSKEKNAFSAKATGHRALAKVYSINEKTWNKSNKTLASMNKAEKENQLKKASEAQKAANAKRDAKEKANKAYKEIDPNAAKNKVTKRAALDYHNMNDLQFMAKYKTSKKTFAKRYEKTKGDTYSLGKKKAAIAAYIVAKSGPVKVHTIRGTKTMQMGKAAAAKALAYDIGTAQLGANVGYKRAEKKYNANKGQSEKSVLRDLERSSSTMSEEEKELLRELRGR